MMNIPSRCWETLKEMKALRRCGVARELKNVGQALLYERSWEL